MMQQVDGDVCVVAEGGVVIKIEPVFYENHSPRCMITIKKETGETDVYSILVSTVELAEIISIMEVARAQMYDVMFDKLHRDDVRCREIMIASSRKAGIQGEFLDQFLIISQQQQTHRLPFAFCDGIGCQRRGDHR